VRERKRDARKMKENIKQYVSKWNKLHAGVVNLKLSQLKIRLYSFPTRPGWFCGLPSLLPNSQGLKGLQLKKLAT
jgi:hypothetical protein